MEGSLRNSSELSDWPWGLMDDERSGLGEPEMDGLSSTVQGGHDRVKLYCECRAKRCLWLVGDPSVYSTVGRQLA